MPHHLHGRGYQMIRLLHCPARQGRVPLSHRVALGAENIDKPSRETAGPSPDISQGGVWALLVRVSAAAQSCHQHVSTHKLYD